MLQWHFQDSPASCWYQCFWLCWASLCSKNQIYSNLLVFLDHTSTLEANWPLPKTKEAFFATQTPSEFRLLWSWVVKNSPWELSNWRGWKPCVPSVLNFYTIDPDWGQDERFYDTVHTWKIGSDGNVRPYTSILHKIPFCPWDKHTKSHRRASSRSNCIFWDSLYQL